MKEINPIRCLFEDFIFKLILLLQHNKKYLARQPGFPPDNKQEVESIITFYTQKSSTIMSIPEKIQEPRNVDLAAAGRGVWLVKVYKLSNKNNSFHIGRYFHFEAFDIMVVTIYDCESKKSDGERDTNHEIIFIYVIKF